MSEQYKTSDSSKSNSILRKIQLILPWLIGFLAILSLISFHASWWLLDIYASFLPQVIIVLVTLYIVVFAIYGRFIVRDGWKKSWSSISSSDEFMLISSGLILIFLITSSVLVIDTAEASNNQANLKVATFNVLYSNPSIKDASNFFKSEDIDIIALEEAKPEFVEEMRINLGFDYSAISNCDCSALDTEVAIISRYPIVESSTIIEHENGGIERAVISLDKDNDVVVYAVHIPPPFSEEWYILRDNLLSKIENRVYEEDLPLIIMGDFNSTVFSPRMQDFIRNSKPRINNISEYSWPKCSWYGFGAITCARIDHIFVSTEFEIINRTIANDFGSDHRPVIAEIFVP